MKVIVAGCRGITSFRLVARAIKLSGFEVTEVVSGCARGVDKLGERWARQAGIPIRQFPAAWMGRDGEYNGKAGFERNTVMAKYADALIAVWDGQTRGTGHMVMTATELGLKVFVVSPNELSRQA